MCIEMFTKNTKLKKQVLTALANEPDLLASGDKISVPGLILHITDNYLLFDVTSAVWADRILPLLFTLNQAGQFYEPLTDIKIIVAARCYNAVKILPHLHEISHLDIENDELLGTRLYEWRSRNVAITASAEIAVQGSILTSRIKFTTHFRDSQYNCQACIEQISLRHLLEPISPEFVTSVPRPKIIGPRITAQQKVPVQSWADFINRQPGSVIFKRETDEYMVNLGETGHIIFIQSADRKEVLSSLEVYNPKLITEQLIDCLHDILGINTLIINHQALDLLLDPDQLIKLSFLKKTDFHSFIFKDDNLMAEYNIRSLQLSININFDLKPGSDMPELINEKYKKLVSFMDMVISVASKDY